MFDYHAIADWQSRWLKDDTELPLIIVFTDQKTVAQGLRQPEKIFSSHVWMTISDVGVALRRQVDDWSVPSQFDPRDMGNLADLNEVCPPGVQSVEDLRIQ